LEILIPTTAELLRVAGFWLNRGGKAVRLKFMNDGRLGYVELQTLPSMTEMCRMEFDLRAGWPCREVEHHEVSPRRTCRWRAEMTVEGLARDQRCGDLRYCITCAAVQNRIQMLDSHFNFSDSEIVKSWEHLKQHNIRFQLMEVEEKIDRLIGIIALHRTERRQLARLGAARLTRTETMELINGESKLNFHYVHMVESRAQAFPFAGDDGYCGIGYVVYKDFSNTQLAKVLDQISGDDLAGSMNDGNKGSIVLSIMGLGFLYQFEEFHKSDMMEGIMEMVSHLEFKLQVMEERPTQIAVETATSDTAEIPVV
jgi:hypothetical protein